MFHRPATQFAPTSRSVVPRPLLVSALALLCIALTMAPAVAHRAPIGGAASTAVEAETQTLTAHLVVSEVMTGGASASDEFVELYNPTAEPLPLEGLEVVYVTASGTTITRKASWSAGATSIPSGAHLLLANAAGIFAAIADATYTNGIAATGGSMALRIQGAGSAIDAVGWGNATSTWLEGSPAPAPAAGSSIERLPGGFEGSGQDTDSNLVDFAIQGVPDPQNSTTLPISLPSVSPTPTAIPTATPSATPSATDTPPASPSPSETASATPTPSATPSPTPIPTPPATPTPTPSATPSPTPSPSPLSIAEVRALPDGTTASIAGIALMASDFTDGGGCVTDETAGLAVLLDAGSFARGQQLSATGSVDDRYAQRTLRVSADAIQSLGPGAEPSPLTVETGAIGEATECQLVNVGGVIAGVPTSLASGLAFEIDDGSGPIRVLVAPASGIDASAWVKDATLTLIGVAGQRDSSGTGAAGYRVLPRDPADVLSVVPAAMPTPAPTATASPTSSPSPTASAPTPSPTPTPPPGLMTIAQARAGATGTTVHVRGIVTLGTGLIDEPTAVIQDASAAIVLRLGDDAAGMTLRRGAYLDVTGIRSTKSGMATIRADVVSSLGTQAEPAATRVTTAAATEPYEARLLVVRGAVVATPVKSTAGNVAFSIDDGSGPLRVTLLGAAQIATNGVVKGAWVELKGVLGQQTTGAQPDRGYRLWPRENGDVQIISGALSGASRGGGDGQLPAGQSRTPSGRAVKPGLSEGTDGSAPSAAAGGGAAGLSGLGNGRPDAAGGPADAADSPADLELTSSRRGDPHLGLALLAAAGACALLFAMLGWRGGTLDRLRTIFQQVAGGRLAPDDGLQGTLVGIGGIHPVATAGGADAGRQADRGPDIGPGSW